MTSFTITVKNETPVTGSSSNISFDDYLGLTALMFEWGDSYDAKASQPPPLPSPTFILASDRTGPACGSIIAPTLLVDYTTVGKSRWESMSASDYMAMVTSPDFLGDPCVKTQHLLGATRWEKVSSTQVIGHHQLRAAHQVYTAPDLKVVKLRGHGHATNEHYYTTNEHYYTKIDGMWKFAGLKPRVNWNEHEFERVFKGSYLEEEKNGANGANGHASELVKMKTNEFGVGVGLQDL